MVFGFSAGDIRRRTRPDPAAHEQRLIDLVARYHDATLAADQDAAQQHLGLLIETIADHDMRINHRDPISPQRAREKALAALRRYGVGDA